MGTTLPVSLMTSDPHHGVVEVKKLHESANIPTKGHPSDAGCY